MTFIIIFVSVLILLLFIPIRFFVIYDKSVSFFASFGFVKIPLGRKKSDKKEKSAANKSGDDNRKQTEKPTPYEKAKKLIKMQDDLKELLSYAAKRTFVVEDITFRLNFGCDSAATTGILTGALNAAVYTLLSVVHHNTVLKAHHVEIKPDFENECFNMYADCICKTRAVHIIVIGIKTLKVLKKYR